MIISSLEAFLCGYSNGYLISILSFNLCSIEVLLNNVAALQDVAVKVLSVQDFLDDQLKEFLREVEPK